MKSYAILYSKQQNKGRFTRSVAQNTAPRPWPHSCPRPLNKEQFIHIIMHTWNLWPCPLPLRQPDKAYGASFLMVSLCSLASDGSTPPVGLDVFCARSPCNLTLGEAPHDHRLFVLYCIELVRVRHADNVPCLVVFFSLGSQISVLGLGLWIRFFVHSY